MLDRDSQPSHRGGMKNRAVGTYILLVLWPATVLLLVILHEPRQINAKNKGSFVQGRTGAQL